MQRTVRSYSFSMKKYEALVATVLQIIETNASEISRLTSLIERMADKDG